MPGESHAEQLKRIAEEMKTLGDEKGWIGFLAGLNIGIIIIDIILAIAALLSFFSSLVDGPVGIALALLLAALAIITGLLKTIACYLLAAELIVLVLAIHLKPALNNDSLHIGMLLKDTAMAMCAILIGNRK